MPGKKHFRYKKGRTEIESDDGDKAAIRLAYLNTILRWLWWPVILIITHFLSG